MSRRKPSRWKVGDVFRVPVDPSRVGHGQIVARYDNDAFYFAIFQPAHDAERQAFPESVVREPVLLLALSLDALLHHGVWAILGNAAVPDLAWPIYKESVAPDVFDVVDHTGAKRRRAAPGEERSLPFRKIVAPIRMQNALQAAHGVGEWVEAYEGLRYVPPS